MDIEDGERYQMKDGVLVQVLGDVDSPEYVSYRMYHCQKVQIYGKDSGYEWTVRMAR